MSNIKPIKLSDNLLDELLDVRNSMDEHDLEIEKQERMAQAWVDAKGKLDDLIAAYDEAYKENSLFEKKAWANPDIADLFERATTTVSKIEKRPGYEGSQEYKVAIDAVNRIKGIVARMYKDKSDALKLAETAMLEQKDFCKSASKQQCYRMYKRLY